MRFLTASHALGFAMLLGTTVLWVFSSVVVQELFEGVHFERPVFVTLFNSATSAALLLPHGARRCYGARAGNGKKGDGLPSVAPPLTGSEDGLGADPEVASIIRLSMKLGLLWLGGQWMFNVSLLHTSVATNTVLSSTSSVFTFFFSLVICGDPFRWLTFAAALFSFTGCVLVTLQNPRIVDKGAVVNSSFGDLLTVSSAAIFALVSVLLRRLAPEGLEPSLFMGANGLIALLLSPVLLLAAHVVDVEHFRVPSGRTLACLTANAALGCTLANYLYTSALLLLTPVAATVGLSMSIPISAFVDEALLRDHRFSTGWMVGAALVGSSVVLAALDLESPSSGADGAKSPTGTNQGEDAAASELQSLLEGSVAADEGDDEDEVELESPGARRLESRGSAYRR
eukprot:gnl/TRDRNA2_/TRDRNA2_81132_c0_seq2.p1 gnl/TRDRNA2_/TRDRNA2_81132_c0~~gnl/TRDRNA2_/TRDRNA2_81132_c0_seq2.p1  ORF type:complete len:399 (+),score=65.08 gnl/TRDRNA2_/TRDRNA2_81132_c0_seq2:111-1307(+)